MTEKMAKREGFGDVLADGVKLAAQRIGKGSEKYAMHIDGQEIPQHDPRCYPGLATAYQIDATPARHTQGNKDWPTKGLSTTPHDKYDYRGRGEDHRKAASFIHVMNSSGVCRFPCGAMGAQSVVDFLNDVCGWDLDLDKCFEIGDRIATIRLAFNLREGINAMQREVPGRVLGRPPVKVGPTKDVTIDNVGIAQDFLTAMGWDNQSMLPSPEKLKELDLEYVMSEIASVPNRIP